MRQVKLDGEFYDIAGDIHRRNINPRAPRFDIGTPGYAAFTQANVEAWKGMRGGIGHKYQERGNTEECYWSEGLDGSHHGGIILGPKVTTAGTFGVAPVAIIDFESNTYAIGDNAIRKWNSTTSNWDYADPYLIEDCEDAWNESVDGDVTSTADTGDKKAGSASAKLVIDAAVSAGDLLATEAISSLNLAAAEKVVLWVKCSVDADSGDFHLLLDDTASCASPLETIDIPALTADTWTQCTLTLANPASDTAIVSVGLEMVVDKGACTLRVDDIRATFPDPINIIVVTDPTDTYLVVSNATSAQYTTDGSSWSALTGCKGYLSVFDNRLCGFYGQTINYSPAKDIDGTWATWDVAAYLGTVHGLFTAKSQKTDEPLLCLLTTEGMWTIDFWVREIYPFLKLPGHTNAGRAGMFWNSYLWVSTGPGIKKISPGIVTDVGPDQEDGLPSGYQGAVYDMTGMADGSWMVYCVNGGSSDKSSIIKRHGTVGGNQQVYTTSAINKAIACVHYSPSSLYTNGRLWWGEDTGIKYCMMPDLNADVTEITSYEFITTSGMMIYSIFRPLEGINKLAIRVRAVTKGCDAGKTITVKYWSDNDATWQTLGTFATSPNPTVLPFASSVGLVFRWIKFGVEMVTDSSTATPELRSLELDYDAAAKRIRGWTFVVPVTQHNAEDTVLKLHTTQDKDTLVLFYPSGDSDKDSYYVKITNLAENIGWDANQQEGQLQVTVEELLRG